MKSERLWSFPLTVKAPSSLLITPWPKSPNGWEIPNGTKGVVQLAWREKKLGGCQAGHFRKPWGRANLAGILRSEKYVPWHGKDVHQLKRWLAEMHLHFEGLIVSYTLNTLFTHTYKISVPNAMVGPGQRTHTFCFERHTENKHCSVIFSWRNF